MLSRLPKPQVILQVYAVIAVMLSAWTITAFLWKLSAWLLLLNLGEIFTIFAYGMFANFLESLIVLFLLLVACAVLPPRILRDDFVVRGTIVAMGLIGALMAFVGPRMLLGIEPALTLLIGPLVVIGLALFLLLLPSGSRFARWIESAALWVSDRLVVFLYILLPLFLVLSAYVLVRNIT